MMKRKNTILLAAVLLLGFAGLCFAQANHSVTIAVNAINQIAVVGGDITLTVTTADAGSAPTAVTNDVTSISFTTNQAKKITAAISAAYPAGITLAVSTSAPSGGGGTAQGTGVGFTDLSTTDADVVTAINKAFSSSTLTYRATAAVTADVDAGTARTVTYTISDI